MARGSRLVALGSWIMAKENWRWVPQAPGPGAKLFLAMSHEPEACAIRHQLSNDASNYKC